MSNSLSGHKSLVALLAVLSVTKIVIVRKDQYPKVANWHEAMVINAVGSNRVTELRGRGREVPGPWQCGNHTVERSVSVSYSVDHRAAENTAKIDAFISWVVPDFIGGTYACNGCDERKIADVDSLPQLVISRWPGISASPAGLHVVANERVIIRVVGSISSISPFGRVDVPGMVR